MEANLEIKKAIRGRDARLSPHGGVDSENSPLISLSSLISIPKVAHSQDRGNILFFNNNVSVIYLPPLAPPPNLPPLTPRPRPPPLPPLPPPRPAIRIDSQYHSRTTRAPGRYCWIKGLSLGLFSCEYLPGPFCSTCHIFLTPSVLRRSEGQTARRAHPRFFLCPGIVIFYCVAKIAAFHHNFVVLFGRTPKPQNTHASPFQ